MKLATKNTQYTDLSVVASRISNVNKSLEKSMTILSDEGADDAYNVEYVFRLHDNIKDRILAEHGMTYEMFREEVRRRVKVTPRLMYELL